MSVVHLGYIVSAILFSNVLKSHCDIILQARYHFNHPPSVDEYNPVPLIVNYYEEGDKSKFLSPNNFNSEKELVSNSSEEVLPPTVPESIINTDTTLEKTSKSEPKERILNEKQIPVTVVYEKDESLDDISIEPKSVEQKQYVQKHRQQKQLSYKDENEYNKATIRDVQTASSTSSSQKQGRQHDSVVPILESENFLYAYRGAYRYGYQSADGTKSFGRGELKTFNNNSTGEAVEGSFSYEDKEGNNYTLTYTADENGYRPVGTHLPTPPPLPPAIERALRYLATKTESESVTEKLKAYGMADSSLRATFLKYK